VQPARLALPELDAAWEQPVAGPAVRACQGLACVDEFARLLVQRVLIIQGLTLV